MPNTSVLESVLPWLQALGLPALAAVGAFIAYQQMLIAKTKLQHDLFDRRIKVFHGIASFLTEISLHNGKSPFNFESFYAATREARFLFPAKFNVLINEIHAKAVKLDRIMNAQDRLDPPDLAQMQKLVDQEAELKQWLLRKHYGLGQVFAPQMHIGPQ